MTSSAICDSTVGSQPLSAPESATSKIRANVAATVYHHLGIDSRSVTFQDKTGRPTYLIENGTPIRELVG